jgi:hypothetical protein
MGRQIDLRFGTVASGAFGNLPVNDVAGLHDLASPLLTQPPTNGLYGMNFEPSSSGNNALYEPRAEIARIYIALGQTNLNNEAEWVRARNLGINNFVLSWKDGVGSTLPWMNVLPSGITWYGVAHHEPEDMTATTYKALQADAMPRVRAHGGIPTAIFTSFSLSNPNNHTFDLSQWAGPPGTHDVLGADFYPDKEPAFNQTQVKQHWVTSLNVWGVDRFMIGEYGVPIGDTTYTAATVTEFKNLMSGFSEANCYWSNGFAGKPDYHFSSSVADAWFN